MIASYTHNDNNSGVEVNLINNVEDREQIIQNLFPRIKQHKGIKPIKQWELFKKWRPLVYPFDLRDSICPKPSDDIIRQFSKGEKRKHTKHLSTLLLLNNCD